MTLKSHFKLDLRPTISLKNKKKPEKGIKKDSYSKKFLWENVRDKPWDPT